MIILCLKETMKFACSILSIIVRVLLIKDFLLILFLHIQTAKTQNFANSVGPDQLASEEAS